MGKVNCTVRGEDWGWPTGWGEEFLNCAVVSGTSPQVSCVWDTMYVLYCDLSGNSILGKMTSSGWYQWQVSGDSFVGISGLNSERCVLVGSDRLYVVEPPTVIEEIKLWGVDDGYYAAGVFEDPYHLVIGLSQTTWIRALMVFRKSDLSSYKLLIATKDGEVQRIGVRGFGAGIVMIQGGTFEEIEGYVPCSDIYFLAGDDLTRIPDTAFLNLGTAVPGWVWGDKIVCYSNTMMIGVQGVQKGASGTTTVFCVRY